MFARTELPSFFVVFFAPFFHLTSAKKNARSAVCIGADSLVTVVRGGRRPREMRASDVVAGDHVQSVDSAGRSLYSEVFLVQHDGDWKQQRMLQVEEPLP